jgi:DNA-3-methyladenine glycosylase II
VLICKVKVERIMYTVTGTLNPTPPFDFDKSLNFLGVFMPTKQEQTISSHTLSKAISIDGQIIVFQLISIGTTEKPGLEYTLFSEHTMAVRTPTLRQ